MTVIERLLATLRQEEDFLCALATVNKDGQPHVRYMKGVIDEHLIIRFPTFASTQKARQIRDCSDVSLTCGDTDAVVPGSYFQIQAKATISQTHEGRASAWTSRLEKWFSGLDDVTYAVVRIEPRHIRAFPIGGGAAADVWTAGS